MTCPKLFEWEKTWRAAYSGEYNGLRLAKEPAYAETLKMRASI
jgi:hypothetical protein